MHMPMLRREWTADDLLDLPNDGNRYEVLDGEAIFAPADVTFSPRRVLEPDVFVIPFAGDRRAVRFSDVGRLLLVAEVLSPSTARADRVAKRTVYREARVPEYWVADLDARTIERSTPADPCVEVLAEKIEWLPDGAREPLRLDLVEFFKRALD